ncbi:MAG: hypothetical protein ACE5HE_05325 [Phycisphaerae bacterium]
MPVILRRYFVDASDVAAGSASDMVGDMARETGDGDAGYRARVTPVGTDV